jgi:hypothetical protein
VATLRELVEALDRRVPHVERLGEVGIAREAAALPHSYGQCAAPYEVGTAARARGATVVFGGGSVNDHLPSNVIAGFADADRSALPV